MAHPDTYALKNLNLNTFLFADVGTELNGSALTILSTLARLGEDPWAEAGRWARLPKAAAIDSLARCIARMPLSPQALADAPVTASQLIQLLPTQIRIAEQGANTQAGTSAMPKWAPIAIIYGALAFGLILNVVLMPRAATAVPAPTAQTVQHTP